MGTTPTDDAHRRGAIIDRFAKKCKDVGDHAIWQGTTDSRGNYGFFRYGGKLIRAHRASWLLFEGPIPKGASVRVKCGTGLCVAPGHLYLDTSRIPLTPEAQ